MKAYAGIGARKTPDTVLDQMAGIAEWLRFKNYTLRSGGASGADTAFEMSAGLHQEIYLARDVTPESLEVAAEFHPAWDRCTDYAKKLMARNSFQILGRHLDNPSDFVVCWTPDGKASGGTGQAIRIANHYGIPVYNLHDDTAEARMRAAVTSQQEPTH